MRSMRDMMVMKAEKMGIFLGIALQISCNAYVP